jgi:hypothetical protein
MADLPIRPFSTWSQDAAWMGRNCSRCGKCPDVRSCTCEIFDALTVAYFTDGTVTPAMALRMGYPGPRASTWDCPERVAL